MNTEKTSENIFTYSDFFLGTNLANFILLFWLFDVIRSIELKVKSSF